MPDPTSADSYYLTGKDAAAKEREQRLLAAKRKLKSYRARQAKGSSIASSDSLASRSTVAKRESVQSVASLTASLEGPGTPHKHRRSISKSALLGERVAPAPTLPSAMGHGRRASKSRHSRGPSLTAQITQIKGHSHQRSRSRASISINSTSRVHAPQDSFSGSLNPFDPFASAFPRSTSPLPPGAKTPNTTANPSVGWITNPFVGVTPAPEASTSKLPPPTLSPTRDTYTTSAPSQPSQPSQPPHPQHSTTSSLSSISGRMAHHERRASRHARQSSVSNFRESLEIVSGQGQYSATGPLGYSPAVSSFAAAPSSVSLSPSNSFQGVAIPMIPITPSSTSPRPNTLMPWEADPAKVLEALKERGRRESDFGLDPQTDRRNALEALEGRVAAPSEMIDLGNEEQGQLMRAPRSPGFTDTGKPLAPAGPLGAPLIGAGTLSNASPSSLPSFAHSPIIGLGVSGKRRDSWNPPGPVTAAGAKGAMDLGMLVEEEEEEEHNDPLISPRRRTPRKVRTASTKSTKSSPGGPISPTPRARTSTIDSVVIPMMETVEIDDSRSPPPPPPPPASSVLTPRPLRTLSLTGSIISSGSPGGTPSSAAPSPPVTRQTPLSSVASPPLTPVEDARTSPTLERRVSMFHSAAVATANGHDMTPSPLTSSPNSMPRSTTGGGLRSLSIGSNTSPPLDRMPNRSHFGQRRVVSGPNQASPSPVGASPSCGGDNTQRRSSITYKTASLSSSLGAQDAPSSCARTQSTRGHQWQVSTGGGGGGAALAGYPFPAYGGFGDLHLDTTDDEDNHSPSAASPLGSVSAISPIAAPRALPNVSTASSISSSVFSASAASQKNSLERDRDESSGLRQQVASLQSQVEHLKASQMQLTSTHALEIADLEKNAAGEVGELRTRIEELEKSLEAGTTARRFELEGLTREIEQAREALRDVIEERDELREDVDGWRKRCASLEVAPRKDREDEALAQAQAKLIGEMRDQILNLACALERERKQHDETRQLLERSPANRAPTAQSNAKPSSFGQQRKLAPAPAHSAHMIIEPTPVTLEIGEADAKAFARVPQHGFKNASDGSVLSGSSFGRSYSGTTTEGTSVDDSYSIRMTSSPPSHSNFGSKGRESDFGSAAALNQLQTLAEEEEEEDAAIVEANRMQHDTGSTGSVSSVAMPLTPNKEDLPTYHHRSHSFVRHWSFPKGSVSSVRMSLEEDHSFFDYNRHTSLPPLPLDAQFPPFITADLTVEEDDLHDTGSPSLSQSAPAHGRRPSSPRPLNRMNPHTRQSSGQYTRGTPPVAPSALIHAQLASSTSSTRSEPNGNAPSKQGLSRFGFGIIGSLSGWSPASSAPATTLPSSQPKTPFSQPPREQDEIDAPPSRRRASSSASRAQIPIPPPPMSSKYSAAMKGLAPQSAPRYIKASEVKRPRASRFAVLIFDPVCCADEDVFHV
ncbi:BQ5605_C002g01448 [Microbotryum silenes-dioicae]|uniref:BQ5605_C002g01448 protein n=1 Tax=Microbotryum silenes-dioicae TaxID=796604 RepID=A0A2X0P1N2_9BASI|nr:BQ5605_C002g01448 [Microbotryum silenes-dioicae]